MTGPDLFTFAEAQRDEQRRAAWLARFERADWVAPHDLIGGTPAGTVLQGWRCPDPECRQVAPSRYAMVLVHGLDPHVPDTLTDTPWCRRIDYHRYRAEVGLPPLSDAPAGLRPGVLR